MTDKATPSPASVDSVMALALELVGSSADDEISVYEKAHDALRAEVERLAAQAAPTAEALQQVSTARGYSPEGSEAGNPSTPAAGNFSEWARVWHDTASSIATIAGGDPNLDPAGMIASVQSAAQSAPFKREDLTLAAVNCQHQIDADCIRLYRDPTKAGSALSQMVDRVVAAIEQGAQPGAEPTLHEIATEVLANRDESVLRDPAWPSRMASPEGESTYRERSKAIRAFVDSAILPLIGQVLEKKLTQAATFMRDELSAAPQPQQEQSK